MIYFIENEGTILKYQYSFDKEKVEELKKKIIENCSVIRHREYQSDYFNPCMDMSLIKNLKWTSVGEKEYFEETRKVYLYSYDEYFPPYLVNLIDRLLMGDVKALDEILNFDVSSTVSIEDRISLANQEFMAIDSKNIVKKKVKLKELEDLLNLKSVNLEQKEIGPYYSNLLNLIQFNLVDSISISELRKVESFLEMEFKIASDSKNKALLKIKK